MKALKVAVLRRRLGFCILDGCTNEPASRMLAAFDSQSMPDGAPRVLPGLTLFRPFTARGCPAKWTSLHKVCVFCAHLNSAVLAAGKLGTSPAYATINLCAYLLLKGLPRPSSHQAPHGQMWGAGSALSACSACPRPAIAHRQANEHEADQKRFPEHRLASSLIMSAMLPRQPRHDITKAMVQTKAWMLM